MDTEQTFRTEVKVTAAWDSGTRERGQHCSDMFFLLYGPKATVAFEVFTGWYLNPKNNLGSRGATVSYHAHSPISEYDTLQEKCGWLGGKICYAGSPCCSQEFFQTLVEKGSEGLWEEMKSLYHDLFDKEPAWLVEPYEQMAAAARQVA